MRVGVLGAAGRMGSTVCQAVEADTELALVAAVDPGRTGADLRTVTGTDRPDLEIAGDIGALAASAAQVAVDFTSREAAMTNLEWCAGHGLHAVVGTTGLGEPDLQRVAELYPPDGALGCVVAANFAIGAVLMMRFAEVAARWFDTAEIIELHHDRKIDAPSGTAMATATRMAAASDVWGADPTESEILAGARGGDGPGGIRIHSVRLRGLVAHQAVLLGAPGQSLTIRHDSYDRTSFMPGVILAVKQVSRRPGLTIGLDPLLMT